MLSPTLEWLFPGLAARGVAAISQGNGGEALGLYLLLSVQAAACIWLAGLAARQFYEGELESGGSAKPVRVPAAQRPRLSLIGPLLGALFHRERVYLIRDPMLKMLLIQTVATMLYVMAMVAFLGFRGAAEGNPFLEELRSYAVLFAGLLLGGLESGTLFNKFGYEGFMLTHVLITPADRGQLLAAKSIFYLSHFATINAVLVIGLGIVLQAPPIFTAAAVLMVLANTAIIDVVGHFVSIYYPFTYRRRGRRMRAVMAQPGCGYVFVYTMVWQACNLAVLPGSAAIALGAIFGGIGGLFLGALIAGSLVFIAYRYGLPYAARLLLAREPELLAVLSKSAD